MSVDPAELTIRRASPEDARALSDLAATTFADTFAADNRPEDMALHLERAYGERQQLAELIDSDITTLLVQVDAALAGYAQLRSGHAPSEVRGEAPLELWRFYMAREWQGRGVAAALMERSQREARARGARTLWLGVWEHNARAQAFYRKHGFVDVGSHVFVVGADAQVDRIFMRSLQSAD